MKDSIEKVLDGYRRVIEEAPASAGKVKHRTYAVSNLRGGIGKTTLTFNLAYELSRAQSVLVADLCAQCSLTEIVMREAPAEVTIYDALTNPVLGAAFGDALSDISYRISEHCAHFRGPHKSYFIAGSAELFSFPSPLYQRLNEASFKRPVVGKLLNSLGEVLDEEAKDKGCDAILLDTSPFYGGATHLAWVAADALIVPVRVDENSIQSLELTLRMLTDPARDFLKWASHAEGITAPKIAAVVMTMVGAKSQVARRPDRASCMYIERAMKIAEKYKALFDGDPLDTLILIDDFVSSGRISGAKSIPIAKLEVHSFHTIHGSDKRLQVNSSAERYQKELKYLASLL